MRILLTTANSGFLRVDYIRGVADVKEDANVFIKEKLPLLDYNLDITKLANAAEISYTPDKVTVTLENGEKVVIADGHNWRLDALGQSALHALVNEIRKT